MRKRHFNLNLGISYFITNLTDSQIPNFKPWYEWSESIVDMSCSSDPITNFEITNPEFLQSFKPIRLFCQKITISNKQRLVKLVLISLFIYENL